MKLKKWLPFLLSVFLLTGCAKVYADDLPELKDAEEWSEVQKVTLKSKLVNKMDGEDTSATHDQVLTFYSNGASFVNNQKVDGEESKIESYLYHEDGVTYAVDIIDGKREEAQTPDPSKEAYDFVMGYTFELIKMVYYIPFLSIYELAKELVDEDAIKEIVAENEDISAIKFTKLFGTYKLEVKGTISEDSDKNYDIVRTWEFGIKDGQPSFIKIKNLAKDGRKVVVDSDEEIQYSYAASLPKYNGPKVN